MVLFYSILVFISFLLDRELALGSLRDAMRSSRRAAYSTGTVANLRTQWRAYLLFCRYFGLSAVPSSSNTICLFAQFLSFSVTPDTIRNYLNGVRLLHLYQGYEFPFLQDFIVKITLKGISRLASHTPKQALAMTISILLKVHSVLDSSSHFELVVFTAALFAFFLLARLSNILPVSSRVFRASKDLSRRSFLFIDGQLIVVFNWSKTIQFGERRLIFPVVSLPDSPICPVYNFRKMISLISAPPSSPAFVFPCKGKLVTLTKSSFIKAFRQLLVRASIPLAYSYTGHSFRRGGATWAFGIGIPGEVIQVLGDWKSDCYKRYFEFTLDLLLQVNQCMRQSLQ